MSCLLYFFLLIWKIFALLSTFGTVFIVSFEWCTLFDFFGNLNFLVFFNECLFFDLHLLRFYFWLCILNIVFYTLIYRLRAVFDLRSYLFLGSFFSVFLFCLSMFFLLLFARTVIWWTFLFPMFLVSMFFFTFLTLWAIRGGTGAIWRWGRFVIGTGWWT